MKYAIDFAILLLLYILCFYKRWRAQGKETVFIRTTMYVYLAFVLYFTLMPITTSLPLIFNHPYVPMNMVPFIDVLEGRGDFFQANRIKCPDDNSIWYFIAYEYQDKFSNCCDIFFFNEPFHRTIATAH